MATHQDPYTRHERRFERNRFVYPVLSRRSGGISVGVNLNPDKVCNFDCIYCQVDRLRQGTTRFVDTGTLHDELDQMLRLVTSGRLFRSPPFCDIEEPLRRLRDIAFSGDGEPTTYRNFDAIVADSAALKRAHGLRDVRMVLITNGSMLDRDYVKRALAILDENEGEIWAKLDAGTEAYYRRVDRTPIPFRRIVENVTEAARARPVVIQSLFMRIDDQGPPPDEQEAFCDRLREIVAAGGRIRRVQVYTVARPPAEASVTPLDRDQVDDIVQLVRRRTGLPVTGFYGPSTGSTRPTSV